MLDGLVFSHPMNCPQLFYLLSKKLNLAIPGSGMYSLLLFFVNGKTIFTNKGLAKRYHNHSVVKIDK
jgi:hypothetical protein